MSICFEAFVATSHDHFISSPFPSGFEVVTGLRVLRTIASVGSPFSGMSSVKQGRRENRVATLGGDALVGSFRQVERLRQVRSTRVRDLLSSGPWVPPQGEGAARFLAFVGDPIVSFFRENERGGFHGDDTF